MCFKATNSQIKDKLIREFVAFKKPHRSYVQELLKAFLPGPQWLRASVSEWRLTDYLTICYTITNILCEALLFFMKLSVIALRTFINSKHPVGN
jgi:hypothetical protein